jgi:hypothetical protein
MGDKNANDHEQQARVHPAAPCYSVVVSAPELIGKHQRHRSRLHGDGIDLPQGPSAIPLDHDAIRWNRIMISSLCLSMIFSENRLPPIGSWPEGMLFRIML